MKILSMVFKNEGGKNVTFRLPNVKDTVTDEQVKTFMTNIIAKNIFSTKGGKLVSIASAKTVDTTETVLNTK